jgi:hypothetical protein
MTKDPDEYNFEVEMTGLYAGGVMGGLFFGAVGDLLKSEIHSMAWYIGGTILGAIGGAIAGAVFRRLVPETPDNGDLASP